MVGVIPAAGTASRLGPLPFSKELFPLGFYQEEVKETPRFKAVGHYLLERMRLADVFKAYMIIRKGKWDIPSHYGDGRICDMRIAYLTMNLPYGVPFTIDQAYPFIRDTIVVFGFPDVIFEPKNAFVQLLRKLTSSKAAIVLGLFKANQPEKEDLVALDRNGKVIRVDIKPAATNLRYTWMIAVWRSLFTEFMHDYVAAFSKTVKKDLESKANYRVPELFLGDIIQTAVESDMAVKSVIFSEGNYIDIGTPENLKKAHQVKWIS